MPRRAIFELKKILETAARYAYFFRYMWQSAGVFRRTFNFFTKVLADQFPNYRTILDKNSFNPATIDRSRFLKTLRRSVCLLSNQFIATKFSFSQNNLHVSMQNKEVGTLDEQIQFAGSTKTKMDIRFYAPYLLNGIQAFDKTDLTFYLKSGTSPIIFEADTDDYSMTYLVMPVSPTAV